jgi:hypothetical protein
MPTAVGIGSPIVALAASAPANTPGPARRPNTIRAASAMPVGGQTTVT